MILTKRQPIQAPKPGLYFDVPAVEYHRWAGASQSTLKKIGQWDQAVQTMVPGPEATPAHVWDYLNSEGTESTEAQVLGERQHALLLEPDRFVKQYRVLPPIDKRTKEGKARYADLCEQYGEDYLISQYDWDLMQGMAAGIAACKYGKWFMGAEGRTEVSGTWRNEATGIDCKMRIDKLIRNEGKPRVIVDLKTTRCAHWRKFERDFADYGYDQQAAWYVDGLTQLLGEGETLFFVVAVEKTPPHCTVVYQVPVEVIEAGRTKNKAAMEMLRQCCESNEWPGYADDRMVPVALPSWAHAEYIPPDGSFVGQ